MSSLRPACLAHRLFFFPLAFVALGCDFSQTLCCSLSPTYIILFTPLPREGLTYQFVDDALDVTSDAETLGKPAAFADLRQGTVTAPILLAARYSPDLMPLIRRHFSQHGDIDRVAITNNFSVQLL